MFNGHGMHSSPHGKRLKCAEVELVGPLSAKKERDKKEGKDKDKDKHSPLSVRLKKM